MFTRDYWLFCQTRNYWCTVRHSHFFSVKYLMICDIPFFWSVTYLMKERCEKCADPMDEYCTEKKKYGS